MEKCGPVLLELDFGEIVVLGNNCRNLKLRDEKDSMKQVVKIFSSRGGPTTTRLEGLVVRTLGSCLRVLRSMGINEGGYGCKKWGKGGYLVKKGGIESSKGIGLQGNDRCEN